MRCVTVRYLAFVALLLSAMGFTSCGPSPDVPVALASFTVTGTSTSAQGVAQIDPSVNSGQFSISWDVTGGIYKAVVAINSTPTFDPNTNIILASSCGQQSKADDCHPGGTLSCTFNNSNIMQCSDPTGPYATQDLTQLLGSNVPDDAYIVIQTCNPGGTVCPVSYVPVQIHPNPGNPVTITSFSVTGASPSTTGGAPINPGVSNGQFSVNWNVAGNLYNAVIALNATSTFDPNTNIVLATSCGKLSASDVCHSSGALSCTFNTSNIMQCSDPAGSYASQNLTAFLTNGVPDNAFIVMQACNPAGTSCPTTSAPVQIQ
ncbi:MAG: hypothetical protein ACYDDO_00650 [Acidiferrobacterales bacterium]